MSIKNKNEHFTNKKAYQNVFILIQVEEMGGCRQGQV